MGINTDGEQYGLTREGCIVSYDYGYADDGCRDYQVGGTDNCYSVDDIVEKIKYGDLEEKSY